MNGRGDGRPAIRRAAPGEAAALSALARRSKRHWGYDEAFMEACREELTVSPETLSENDAYVIDSESVPVGFYLLVPGRARTLELDALFVAPEAHGRGFGRALVAHARWIARARGATALVVQSDPNADGFYEALGGRLGGERESRSIPGRMLRTYRFDLDGPGAAGDDGPASGDAPAGGGGKPSPSG